VKPVEILLVEDNAGDAVLIRQVLADSPIPVHLHIARDGEQALLMLASSDFKPDLIILDLNIPRIPGAALLERWRPGGTPVVVFSSSLNEAERKHVLELGACEFVPKPTDLQAFINAVFEIVQKWGTPQVNGTAV
jgi:DNA-binding response OmpR family regulator